MTSLVRRAAGAALLVAAVTACAAAPHRYGWQPPVPVTPEDLRACHARADHVAQQRYDRYMEMVELAGPFGGLFGGVTLGQRAWDEREDFYEWEMKDCLHERSYQF